jgi:hypothetical protein
MEPQVWAAIIAAAASMLVALASLLSSWRTQRRNVESQKQLEELKDQLADRASTRNAWLEYEFEARKRLYEECAPLVFQLSEQAERALGRIYGLARTAADGDLDAEKSWLGRGYYSNSTYYRLIAPLSVGRLFRQRLTHLDLSIDANVQWQYTLVRVLMDSFTDDFDLAGKTGEVTIDRTDWLDYEPHADDAGKRRLRDPQKYWQQGVPRGILEDAVRALILDEERILDFMEFQARRDDAQSDVHRAFHRIGYLFNGFHPRTRPVLWRVLVAQASLYEALVRAPRHGGLDETTLDDFRRVDRARLDWRAQSESESPEDADQDQVDQAIRVGLIYAEQRTRSYFTGDAGSG